MNAGGGRSRTRLGNRSHLAAWLLALSACQGGEEGVASPRPNVLLVSIDSLRADHLGCYGYGRPTSPHIDRLADEGALFLRAYSSSSWTLPAHAALFTAQPDSVHGCSSRARALDAGHTTLAEALGSAGYETAGFWSGPLLDPAFGLDQGFESYVDCTGYRDANADGDSTDAWSHEDVTGPRVLAAFRAWFATRSARPFFAFVHLWDVHYDFIPPAPYDGLFDSGEGDPGAGRGLSSLARLDNERRPSESQLERMIALYDGEIAWTDHHVGELIEVLGGAGLLDETLVVVTADHGEEFFEHGQFGHRKELFEESVHVPLVLRYPPRIPARMRLAAPIRIIDVAPTILEYVGVEPLVEVLGRSWLSRIEGAPVDPPPALSELEHPAREDRRLALHSTEWKLVLRSTGDGQAMLWWDLSQDPGEQRPLTAETLPLEARRALRATRSELKRLQARVIRSSAAQSPRPDLERQLQALGYVESEDD